MSRSQLTVDKLYDLVIDKLVYESVQAYIQHVSRSVFAGSPFLHSPNCCIALDIAIYNGSYNDHYCRINWCKKRYGTRRMNVEIVNEYHTYC